MSTGLWAGVIGLVGGVLTFFGLGHWGVAENNGVASAARGLFYLPQEGDWRALAVVDFPSDEAVARSFAICGEARAPASASNGAAR